MILIDRSDTGTGNFDIEYNYNSIRWEAGDVSGGVGGLGGSSTAVMGYAVNGTIRQWPGSLVAGAFLDGGPNSLVAIPGGPASNTVAGRYIFAVRGGVPDVPGATPDLAFRANQQQLTADGRTLASFNNVPSNSWFNPVAGTSADYIARSGLFTTTTLGDDSAQVFSLIYDNVVVSLAAGASYTFPGQGVSSFRLLGDPGTINLAFGNNAASFDVVVATPEPGTILAGSVALLLAVFAQRLRKNKKYCLTELCGH